MKNRVLILLAAVFLTAACTRDQVLYQPIDGWSVEINNRIENFLDSTKSHQGRKVAVFDCDGTVFGQVPHYLADEALYQYADEVLKKRNDDEAAMKLAILKSMVEHGDNVSKRYVEDRIHFLAGLTPEEIEELGYQCYLSSYQGKFYPEMKELIENLKRYDFEVWIITASPEILYQKFVAMELGIPEVNVIGVKSVVKEGRTTSEIILPIPQDDGKAHAIETFIKTRPLIVGGNSRGDMDMVNESSGLKMMVNPDDVTVRGPADGPMSGHTVKSFWEKEGALIVKCNDVTEPGIRFHTAEWGIKPNMAHPKDR